MARLRRFVYALPVALTLLIGSSWDRDDEQAILHTLPYAVPCISGLTPSGCIFGMADIQYVVHSSYAYEAGLLPSHIPVADTDYILPTGWQENVRLPGGSWDHFRYYGAVYVLGSGWVASFCRLQHSGCFSFLHLQYVSVTGRATVAPPATGKPPTFNTNDGLDGDERTARAAVKLLHALPPATSSDYYSGGQVVGLSRWPDWSIFGNGSYGPNDAHLCVLYDQAALDFFWNVATGRDHAPKSAFPRKKWGRTPYKDRHGHLIWSAAWTWHHHATWLYPHVRGDRWYGHIRGRRYGYMDYRFRHGHLRCWPHWRTCKASKH